MVRGVAVAKVAVTAMHNLVAMVVAMEAAMGEVMVAG